MMKDEMFLQSGEDYRSLRDYLDKSKQSDEYFDDVPHEAMENTMSDDLAITHPQESNDRWRDLTQAKLEYTNSYRRSRNFERRYVQKKRVRVGRVLLFVCLVVALVLAAVKFDWSFSQLFMPEQAQVVDVANRGLDIYSANGVLVATDGEILWSKAADERIYPASLTKIMTALVSLENLTDLKQRMVLPKDIYPSLYKENASLAGFQAGEEVSYQDLLYGVMLPSGAECALALANQVSGSEADFVALMNERAAEMGLTDTHFANCTGLSLGEHYTTVHDLAVILQAALENKNFREIFTSSSYVATNGLNLETTLPIFELKRGHVLGGKTGFTNEAGHCLASLAEVEGQEFLLVTTGAGGESGDYSVCSEDAKMVYQNIEI